MTSRKGRLALCLSFRLSANTVHQSFTLEQLGGPHSSTFPPMPPRFTRTAVGRKRARPVAKSEHGSFMWMVLSLLPLG